LRKLTDYHLEIIGKIGSDQRKLMKRLKILSLWYSYVSLMRLFSLKKPHLTYGRKSSVGFSK